MTIWNVLSNQTLDDVMVFHNGTNPPLLYLEQPENRPLLVVAALLLSASAIVGTLGNLLIIVTICGVRGLRTTGNMFVLNLALADIVITLLIDPFNAVGTVDGRKVLVHNYTLCNFVASFCAPACLTSMWNMCAISINRYMLICKPHLYPRVFTFRNSIMGCVTIWIMSHLFHLPNHLGWGRNRFNEDYYLCTFDIVIHSYAIFYVMMGIIIPLIGVLFGYTAIFYKVRLVRQRLRFRSAGLKQSPGSKNFLNLPMKGIPRQQTTTTTDSGIIGPFRNLGGTAQRPARPDFKLEDVKLAKTLFAAFLVFFICWLPFAMFVLAHQPKEVPGWIYVLAIILAHGNSAVNPVLYGMMNESFRNGYRRVLGIRSQCVGDAGMIGACGGKSKSDRRMYLHTDGGTGPHPNPGINLQTISMGGFGFQ